MQPQQVTPSCLSSIRLHVPCLIITLDVLEEDSEVTWHISLALVTLCNRTTHIRIMLGTLLDFLYWACKPYHSLHCPLLSDRRPEALSTCTAAGFLDFQKF